MQVVENALRGGGLFRGCPYPLKIILEKCGRSHLQILGLVNSKESIHAPSLGIDLLAFIDRRLPFPRVQLINGMFRNCQVIMFKRPDPSRMQYMSLEPMTLSLADQFENESLDQTFSEDGDAQDRLKRQRLLLLVERMKLHTVERNRATRKDLTLPVVINQINCCHELNALMRRNAEIMTARPQRAFSASERVVESAGDVWNYAIIGVWYLWIEILRPIFHRILIRSLIVHRVLSEVVLLITGWRLVAFEAPLKDISATAQQVDLRLQQFCYWPVQYLTLLKRKDTWASITTNHTEYIRYYNSLWLVANDVIMGIAIGSYILENADAIADQMNILVGAWSVTGLQQTISWLMDYPAGLKLNTELARFLGDLFLWVVDYWAGKTIAILWTADEINDFRLS